MSSHSCSPSAFPPELSLGRDRGSCSAFSIKSVPAFHCPHSYLEKSGSFLYRYFFFNQEANDSILCTRSSKCHQRGAGLLRTSSFKITPIKIRNMDIAKYMLVRIRVCLFSVRAPESVNSTLDFESSQLLSSLNRLVSSYQNPSRQKRRILSTFWNSTF